MTATSAAKSVSATPILDRLYPMPEGKNVSRSSRRGLVAGISAVCLPLMLIGLMIWSPAFLAFAEQILRPARKFLDTTIDSAFSGQWGGLVIAALLPFSLVGVIVIHEIGHLICGLSAGFRLIYIRFGPVRISPPFRVSFKIEPRTGALGAVNMIPVRSENLRSRAIFFVLGGPLANVLAGAIVLFLKPVGPAAVFAVLSVVIGIGNLVPFRRLATFSDGKRGLMLLRNKGQGERWLSILQLADEVQSGVDPENLSPDFLAKVKAVKDESPDTVVGYALAYSAAWYGNDVDETAQLLETCLEYAQFSSPAMREVLKSSAAVFQGRKKKRIDLAEGWLSEIPEKTTIPKLRLYGESAILEAQGDLEGAVKKLDEIETTFLAIPDTQQRAVSQRSLQRWRRELLEKRPSA
ncbi:MAG TPA: M50 family metallopeptidase [Candidatus Acidoferrum sp.]|nr:M50 family metallopeptidase [Candidatus Acidoferrum sp.]